MSEQQLHERVMERLYDLYDLELLSIQEFEEAYDTAKEFLTDEYGL